ncbi:MULTISPECIES: spore germination protein GerPB [Bacillus]|uniref:Spore gernimation protein GerPB n=2 Tax=Bacillus TaxID=1386 RepID=A0A0M3R922_9BACI|nr:MULTISPECIES: spore germination protein GerPB [Bacillus]ALC80682.1 spore gernimation protein GerPB [Bacillus gobiensis]MBP1079572.1 spore germination protein PB [Bacillus capparidis]MED1094973.1 spore germination protein GerPB [Bacillus capparidis]
MNFYINQSIHINYLRVESVSNSSVLQIGSAGSIKSLSNLYNTGSYTEPAPEVPSPGTGPTSEGPSPGAGPESFVPLQSPVF